MLFGISQAVKKKGPVVTSVTCTHLTEKVMKNYTNLQIQQTESGQELSVLWRESELRMRQVETTCPLSYCMPELICAANIVDIQKMCRLFNKALILHDCCILIMSIEKAEQH